MFSFSTSVYGVFEIREYETLIQCCLSHHCESQAFPNGLVCRSPPVLMWIAARGLVFIILCVSVCVCVRLCVHMCVYVLHASSCCDRWSTDHTQINSDITVVKSGFCLLSLSLFLSLTILTPSVYSFQTNACRFRENVQNCFFFTFDKRWAGSLKNKQWIHIKG